MALLQTLYATGGRTSTLTTISGLTAVETQNTAAGTHDDLTSTLDGVTASGDDILAVVGSATLRVLYSLDICNDHPSIDFVRLKAQAVKSGVADTASVAAVNDGSASGSPQSLSTMYADYQTDFLVDPADGGRWTPTKINARKWGVLLASITASPLSSAQASAPEMRLEVWGVPPSGFALQSSFHRSRR